MVFADRVVLPPFFGVGSTPNKFAFHFLKVFRAFPTPQIKPRFFRPFGAICPALFTIYIVTHDQQRQILRRTWVDGNALFDRSICSSRGGLRLKQRPPRPP